MNIRRKMVLIQNCRFFEKWNFCHTTTKVMAIFKSRRVFAKFTQSQAKVTAAQQEQKTASTHPWKRFFVFGPARVGLRTNEILGAEIVSFKKAKPHGNSESEGLYHENSSAKPFHSAGNRVNSPQDHEGKTHQPVHGLRMQENLRLRSRPTGFA